MRPLIVIFLAFHTQLATAEEFYGKYIGTVVAEWLDDGRTMKLASDFAYIDPDFNRWDAPAGSVVDGASIPQFAWSIIGGPFEGPYRNASVIHDVACVSKKQSWQNVHRTFYNAMLASNVDRLTAKIMYAAVFHFGPRWTGAARTGPHLPEPELRVEVSRFDNFKEIIELREINGNPMSLEEIESLR